MTDIYRIPKENGPVNAETNGKRRVLLSPEGEIEYENLSMDDKLYRTRFDVDPKESHLAVNNEICKTCPGEWCLYICPSQNFSKHEDGSITVVYEGCFECGSCRVVCLPGGLSWKYPLGGYGFTGKYG